MNKSRNNKSRNNKKSKRKITKWRQQDKGSERQVKYRKYFKKEYYSDCFKLKLDQIKLIPEKKINLLFMCTGVNPDPELEYIKFLKKLGFEIENIFFFDIIYTSIDEKEMHKIFKNILSLKSKIHFFSDSDEVIKHLMFYNIKIDIVASYNFQIASRCCFKQLLEYINKIEKLFIYLYEKNNYIISIMCTYTDETQFIFNEDMIGSTYNSIKNNTRILTKKINDTYFFEGYE